MTPLPRKTGPVTLMRRLGGGAVTEQFAAILDEPAGTKVHARVVNPLVASDPVLGPQLRARLADIAHLRAPNLAVVLPPPTAPDLMLLELDPGGITLEQVLAACKQRQIRMPAHLFLHVAVEVCNALATLHAQPDSAWQGASMLHARLTPATVHLVPGGRVVLGGYALLRSPLDVPAGATQAPPELARFLCPEQVQSGVPLTPASDLFSLGSLLYECLTLEPLFGGQSELDAIFQLRHADVKLALARAGQLLPGVDRVLGRALTQEPPRRYQQAFVLREDLRGLMARYSFANIEAALDAWLAPFLGPSAGLATYDASVLDPPPGPSDTGSLLASSVQPARVGGDTLAPPEDLPERPRMSVMPPLPPAPPAPPAPKRADATYLPPEDDLDDAPPEPLRAAPPQPIDEQRMRPDDDSDLEPSGSGVTQGLIAATGVALVVGALICAVGGGGLWWYTSSRPAPPSLRVVATQPQPTQAPAEVVPTEDPAEVVLAEQPAKHAAPGVASHRTPAPSTASTESPSAPSYTTTPRVTTTSPSFSPRATTQNLGPSSSYLDDLAPPPLEPLDNAVVMESRLEGDDLAAMIARAETGKLTPDDRSSLEAVPITHADFTPANLALYQDAKARDDQRGRARYLAQIMSSPENQYNPMLLVEDAELLIRRKRYAQALAQADLAERYWARLPSEHIFSRKAMIYEIQAGAHQGLFYESGGENMAELDAALAGWERYRRHAETKSRTDLAVKADAQITRLSDMKRRLGG